MKKTSKNTGNKATVIPADGRLKDKIGRKKLESLISSEQIAKAQNTATRSAELFLIEMEKEVVALEAAYRQIKDSENTTPPLNEISSIAFTIKSDAGTFGIKIASDIARLLMEYIAHNKKHDPAIIATLINALKSICIQRITGDGGKIGKELIESLIKLINKGK